MIKLYETGAYYAGGKLIPDDENAAGALAARGLTADREAGAKKTIAWSILEAHNTSGNMDELKIKFDAMASHDITYVGIIQTARASGLERFPLPYVLTNCHNSLCAVGGTINEDDHMFGLSAAKKYGGIYVPAHQAVIHQYMREMMSGCGKMILGSDSHTRYGALGTMAVGEGGPELVKQLLNRTYDIKRPQVVAVYLTGRPHPGVGPQDVALAIIGAVFKRGYVKNKVMEFIGDGIASLGVEYYLCPDFEEIKAMTPEQFVLGIIRDCNARALFCGENFTFGARAAGTPELLRQLCEPLGVEVVVLPMAQFEEKPVSSTRIRTALEGGDIPAANAMLGMPYAIRFTVHHGAGLGRTLGVPTINQLYPQGFQLPRYGIYITRTRIGDRWYPSATGLGTRPTVNSDESKVTCETFIPGFTGDLYGTDPVVEFHAYLSPSKKFDTLDELRACINNAAKRAQEYFA